MKRFPLKSSVLGMLLSFFILSAAFAQQDGTRKESNPADNPLLCLIDTSSHCSGDVWVAVVVQNGVNLDAISIVFTFDTSVITYQNLYAQVHPGLSTGFLVAGSTLPNKISLAWYSITSFSISNDTLISFKFHYSGGTSALAWDAINCIFSQSGGVTVPAMYQNGQINDHGYAPFVVQQPQPDTVFVGSNALFAVAANYTASYAWQLSADGGVTWSQVPASLPYSGVTDDTLIIIGVTAALHNTRYRCLLTGSCPLTKMSNPAKLSVQIPFSLLFHENFEPPGYADSVVSSQTPLGVNHWNLDSIYFAAGTHSIRGQVPASASAYLSTPPFSTIGMTHVLLNFSHICMVDTLDLATVWVSADAGTTWVQAGCNEYLGYGLHCQQGERFSLNSYKIWDSVVPGQLPDNAWWVPEYLNLTGLLSNTPTAMIRFELADGGSPGANGMYGWLIDNIRVMDANYLGGRVQYASQPPQPFRDSTLVYLKGPVTRVTPVDAGGGFSFIDIPSGNYTLTDTTTKMAGGWNGTDAYTILANFASSPPLLTGIYLTVADVNGSGGIPNAADALAIRARFLCQIESFSPPGVPFPGRPDWFSEKKQLSIGPVIYSGNILRNLCTGDPNASFILFP